MQLATSSPLQKEPMHVRIIDAHFEPAASASYLFGTPTAYPVATAPAKPQPRLSRLEGPVALPFAAKDDTTYIDVVSTVSGCFTDKVRQSTLR